MDTTVIAKSAKLGDDCVRDIPRLLTKEEIRDLSRIDSRKFTLAIVIEVLTIAAAIAISETWWNPVIYLLAVIVIGSRINGLGGLMHDAAHYRGYSNRAGVYARLGETAKAEADTRKVSELKRAG